MEHRLFRTISMVWVGSLLTLGLVAAPVLFSMLDRTSAGSVAAQLFRIEAIIGVICALALIIIVMLLDLAGRIIAKAFAPKYGR